MPLKPSDRGFFMVLVPGEMHSMQGNFSYVANELMK